jgi:hypothetical protein
MNITIDAIKRATAEYFSISVEDLIRSKPSGVARHAKRIAIHLIRKLTLCSLQEVATAFGFGDASSVMSGRQETLGNIASDARYRDHVLAIERRLNSPRGNVLTLSTNGGDMKTYLDESQSLRVSALVEEMGLSWVA